MSDASIYRDQPEMSETHEAAELHQPAAQAFCAGRVQNIGQTERVISTLGGSAMLAAGLLRLVSDPRHGALGGLLLTLGGSALVYRGVSGHCACYEALGIDTAEHNSATVIPARQGVKVERSLALNCPLDDLYTFWSNLENLPRVMSHLQSVDVLSEGRSRWVATGPLGKPVTWEAEIIEQREPEIVSWRSLPGGDIDTAGSVRFKQLSHDRGTALVVSMKYNPPGGKLGEGIASLLGSGLEDQLDSDLRRFKSIMEAGEAPTTAGQPSGRD